MSSTLTKLITSYVGARALQKMYHTTACESVLAFSGIHIAMTFFDVYRNIINGTTKNIITKDSEGHFICTKYNVKYIDTKIELGFISGVTSAVIGGYIGDDPLFSAATYFIIGTIAGETIADALNFDPIIIAHELNGDSILMM